MRTIVDLPKEDIAELDRLSKGQSVSRAKLIREAVESYLEQHKPLSRESAFGSWQDKTDSRKLVDSLRDEWQ